jgi:hypothetical protein
MKFMNLAKILGLTIVLAASAAVAAVTSAQVTGSFRYKMTVEVETPEGIRTGSAVREATVSFARSEELRPYDHSGSVRGEAVVVDLGKRGLLFAIMGTDDYMQVFYRFPGPPGMTPEGIKYYEDLQYKHPKVALNIDTWPRLVHFRDIRDPKTVELALETEGYETPRPGGGFVQRNRLKADHFEEMFGKGVKLKSITLEMTRQKVTRGIEGWLPWLEETEATKARLNGNTSVAIFTNELSDNLGSGSFRIH